MRPACVWRAELLGCERRPRICRGGGLTRSSDDPSSIECCHRSGDRRCDAPRSGLNKVVDFASGWNRACALTEEQRVFCWGEVTTIPSAPNIRSSPLEIEGLEQPVAIEVSVNNACAVQRGGTVKCWGDNHDGQLGNGTTQQSATPTLVQDLSGVVELALGFKHACARLDSGRVRCWGSNAEGQLGDGTRVGRLTPVDVINLQRPSN